MNSTISFEKPETIVIALKGKPEPADMEYIFQKVNEYIKAGLEKARVLMNNSELENIPPQDPENNKRTRVKVFWMEETCHIRCPAGRKSSGESDSEVNASIWTNQVL